MYYYAQIAFISFIAAAITYLICEFLRDSIFSFCYNYKSYCYWITLLNYKILCLITKCIYDVWSYEIAVRAIFLGYSFSAAVTIYITALKSWKIFGIYAAVLSTFHFSEFLSIGYTNPKAVSSDSFVINHSVAYTLAAVISWMEFFIERYFFPEMKEMLWISLLGVIFCGVGELIRKAAIFTAKKNFNHVIQDRKEEDHVLVTHGVYKFCRHPSYVGWFYWSIGTQLILQNPLCLLTYIFVTWKFMNDRIYVEEISLVKFFGDSYVQYQKKVGTGLPFIRGYKSKTQ